jgi:tetratricopeptide (TPR) repeat protein
MSFQIINKHLSPAEGESVVRTYHCTSLSPVFALIGLKTDGYLTVTNKRLIYYSEGSSVFGVAGGSKHYDEVPLADVANLSLSRGTRFSFLRLLGGLLFGQIPGCIIVLVFLVALSMLGRESEGGNSYLLRLDVFLQLSAAGLLVLRSLSIPRESVVRFMLAASGLLLVASTPVLALACGNGMLLLPPIYRSAMLILSVPLLGYWLWCLYWFIRREYLILAIRSKTNWPPSIHIAGVSWWGRINVAADLACGMAPAVDAESMFKELGAMVTDIQTLGDHGIKKWQQPEADLVAEGASQNRPRLASRTESLRYALAWIAVVALLVGAESVWYARGEKRMLATQMRGELARARNAVQSDSASKVWTPKLLASADQEAVAGETAFGANKFTDAMAHWKIAINTYTVIPGDAAALQKASVLQSQYETKSVSVYLQETASERLKSGNLMKAFSELIDQHPSPNVPWKTVRQSAEEARGIDEQNEWYMAGSAWALAGSSLPQATQLMRADICVKLAENEIKKDNATGAMAFAGNALVEIAGYPDAMQRMKLAMNMNQYAQWLQGENEKGTAGTASPAEYTRAFDQFGGEDWKTIKELVGSARTLANGNDWDKSNEAWESALSKMPGVILAVRLGRAEVEARRGNWSTVATLTGKVLQDHPENVRAAELKKKADGIEAASQAEWSYYRTMYAMLNREVTENQIKVGDMTDFIAHMDRYGQDEWAQVKDAISKAEAYSQNEQGAESLSEWSKAIALFPSAVQRMRAEIWMEQADLAAKNNDWAKVLIFAERALKEKPDHVLALQLRDQADAIEEKRLNQAQ